MAISIAFLFDFTGLHLTSLVTTENIFERQFINCRVVGDVLLEFATRCLSEHKCSEQKDITSAAYWSCKMWEKTSSVSDNIGKSADETIFKAISLKLDLTKTLK